VDCPTFDRWLSDGRPAGARGAAERHAEGCARCREELADAVAVERALAQRFATTPASFTDRVMERIGAEARLAAPPLPEVTDPLPWWIRAVQDPATVLACLLAAITLAVRPELAALARDLGQLAPPALATVRLGAPLPYWVALPALAGLLAASAFLFRGALRWADRP